VLLLACILLANFFFLDIAYTDEVKNNQGKLLIKSLPMKCDIFFLDESISKSEDIITINAPAGNYPINFKLENNILEAELRVNAKDVLLVNGNFDLGKVLVTPNIHIGKDGAPMVLVPAGDFQMGSEFGEPDEVPVHRVYLDAFYMDVYEVTNSLYKKFMDETGHKPPLYWEDPRCNAPDQPVVGVTWEDAKAYCKWAAKRLPTEAEWEKAARGGLAGKIYPWGNEDNTPTAGGGNLQGVSGAFPVGGFPPNDFGLHDMARNAWEWCLDWYSEGYYAKSPENNPKGPDSGEKRVLRGGSWFAGIATPLPVSYRYSIDPEDSSNLIGFRCVSQDVR
jgi:formylglycine-generating enzyme required for sulfatase activity